MKNRVRVTLVGITFITCLVAAVAPTYAASRLDVRALDAMVADERWTDLIGALRALPMSEHARPLFACYASLAYYGANQLTAGSDQSADCARQPPGVKRDTWTRRLDDAQRAAERNIDDALASDCGSLSARVAAHGGLAGCGACRDADKMKLEFSSIMAKTEITKALELHKLVIEPERAQQLRQKQLQR